jgi:acetyl-CoA carboxylase biotin carboxyl carrier protein
MTEKKIIAEAAKDIDPKGTDPKGIDPKLVETLGEIATRLDLSEVEVVQGDLKIRVARQMSVAPLSVASVAPASVVVAAPPRPAAAQASLDVAHPGTITSPMVGTAYLRAAPEAPRFVEQGAQVKAGETLLLIEAMKTFNEIVAPRAGVVVSILVEDTQPVEFGQPLIVIE